MRETQSSLKDLLFDLMATIKINVYILGSLRTIQYSMAIILRMSATKNNQYRNYSHWIIKGKDSSYATPPDRRRPAFASVLL